MANQFKIKDGLYVSGSARIDSNTSITGSLNVVGGITGSLFGTSSQSVSSSYTFNADKLDDLDSTSFVFTSSYDIDSSSFSSRTSLIESKYATTGSNTFTGPQYISHASNAIGFTSTASLYTDGGLRVTKDAFVSGTLYLKNLTVYGTSSIQYITSSQINIGGNIINLNTNTPAVRFGGITVIDSGSLGSTGSLFWDSQNDRWVYSNPSGSTYDGGMLISGPRNTSGLGNEVGTTACAVMIGQGGDHITSSGIFSYGNATCFYGGTSVITANSITSSQITATSFTGSLFGTSSQAVSSSYALTASYSANVPVTSSYALQALSSSYALTASYSANVPVTSSYALQALSASYALTASYAANVPVTASYALTASQATSASYAQTSSYSLSGTGFPFSGSAVITGSLLITNLSGSGVRYVVTDANGLMTAQTASTVLKTTQTYTASAGQTTFSVTNGYSTGYVDVFINGSKLNGSEFTDTSGTNVVLATGSFVNDIVEVVKYLPAQGVSNNVLRTLTTFTAANSQSTYNVSYTPGLLDIFYNGSRLSPIEYTANNGTSFTLATASAAGDTLDVLVYSYQVGAYAGIGGSGQLNQVSYYTTTSSISGSNNFTFDGSTLRVTGSIITSGSSTFTNIGPTILSGSVAISGSLTVTQGVTISGSIASASYASNAELLDNLDSTAFVFTSSFNTYSSSMSTRTSNLESTASVLTSASASLNTASGSFSTRVTKIEGNYATTGSNVFIGTQTITGSLLVTSSLSVNGCIVSTGQIVAQTINVQQVTSSVVYSCGNNIFGCSLANTQQFTGSVTMTGSLAVFTAGTTPEFQVAVGGTTIGNALTDVHNVTGSLRITGSSNHFILGSCVAIGTTTPYSNLQVLGTIKVATGNAQGILGLGEGNGTTVNVGLWRGAVNNPTSDGNYLNLGGYDGIVFAASNAAIGSQCERFRISSNGTACFACDLTAKTIGTNDLILNNLNYECANYVDGTRGSWLIQEGACDLFIINQVSGKKYKFNLIEIK